MENSQERFLRILLLSLICLIGIVYLFLAFNKTMIGEDEGSYFNLALHFKSLQYPPQDNYSTHLYTLPPLLSFISSFGLLLSENLTSLKLVSALFGILTVFTLYIIGKKFDFFTAPYAIFILFTIPIFSQFIPIAYVDIPVTLLSIMSTYSAIIMNSKKYAILTGSLLALAFFAKLTGIFLIGSLGLYALYKLFKKDYEYFKLALIALIISGVLISPWIIRNFLTYGYTAVFGLDDILRLHGKQIGWQFDRSVLTPQIDYFGTFGWLAISTFLSYAIYKFYSKDSSGGFILFLVAFFLIVYFLSAALNLLIPDSRYFLIVVPQISLLGGYYLSKLHSLNKYFMILFIALLAFGTYTTVTTVAITTSSQRYSPDYIQSLEWINTHIPKDSIIFTAFGGSVKVYAGMDSIWSIPEFPQLMTANNSTYIHNILKSYNVSYILIPNGLVSTDYIVPHSNLIGIFTYKFVDTVKSDNVNFTEIYNQQNNLIFKVN